MPQRRSNPRRNVKPRVPLEQRFTALDTAFQKNFSYGRRDDSVRILKQSFQQGNRLKAHQIDAAVKYLQEYVTAALKLNERKKLMISGMQSRQLPVSRLRIQITEKVGEHLREIQALVEKAQNSRASTGFK